MRDVAFITPFLPRRSISNSRVSTSRCEFHGLTTHHAYRPIAAGQVSPSSHPRGARIVSCLSPPKERFDGSPSEKGAEPQTLYLIDAMSLIYRSYHALNQATFSSRALADSRAVYGFTLVILSLISKFARDARIAVVFEGTCLVESGVTDFRTAVYEDYKATRPPAPRGVSEAVPWVKRVVEALGCAVVEVPGFEADDVIGTLAHRARTEFGCESVIVSTDKDFRQLLEGSEPSVRILRPVSGSLGGGPSYEFIDEARFREEYSGLAPRRFVDILALVGDKVDNIPGVPSIGAKTAPRLVVEFGTLQNLLAAAEAAFENSEGDKPLKVPGLTPRLVTILRENAEFASLSEMLVKIKEDVPMENFRWDTLRRRRVDPDAVAELGSQLEFKRELQLRMLGVNETLGVMESVPPAPEVASTRERDRHGESPISSGSEEAQEASAELEPPPPTPALDYQDFSDASEGERQDALSNLLTSAKKSGTCGVAIVADSNFCISGVAVSVVPGCACYFPVANGEISADLQAVLTDPSVEKRGWDMKRVCQLLDPCRLQCLFDARIACDLMYAGQNVTDVTYIDSYLGSNALADLKHLTGVEKHVGAPTGPSAALELADIAQRLGNAVRHDLEARGASFVAREIEFPLVPVLADMETVGVPFDKGALDATWNRVEDGVDAVGRELVSLVPSTFFESSSTEEGGERAPKLSRSKAWSFSVTSRDDVSSLLYDFWGVPVKYKTAGGKPTTDKRALEGIANDETLAEEPRAFATLMMKHRELSKIATTYTRSLSKSISPRGRIHTTLLQGASASGRLSTSRPNLQSIPSRSALGREIRGAVSPPPGRSIICADYSQIELRILAALSGDEAMCAAFESGADIHTAVAAQIFGVDEASVTPTERSRAKAVSFGIPYGISAYGLSQQLSITLPSARKLIKDFYIAYPGVEQLAEDLVRRARFDGYAETLCGRRLCLPLLREGGKTEQRAAERVAINMPIQGTQADMIKLAMSAIWKRLSCCDGALVLQVHDELVVEINDKDIDTAVDIVCQEMCSSLTLPNNVDVVVKFGVGRSWLAAAESSRIWVPAGREDVQEAMPASVSETNVSPGWEPSLPDGSTIPF